MFSSLQPDFGSCSTPVHCPHVSTTKLKAERSKIIVCGANNVHALNFSAKPNRTFLQQLHIRLKNGEWAKLKLFFYMAEAISMLINDA